MGIVSHEQVALLTDYDPDSAYTTAYHTLYANICFNWDRERNKQFSLALASPVATPAQAMAAANLAIAAAHNGTRTILIEADIQQPSFRQRFGLDNELGLSELLSQTKPDLKTITSHLSTTFIPDLYVLSAGNVSLLPSEISRLLSANLHSLLTGLNQFLEEAPEKPGLIIFSSPPVLKGINALYISSLVDQTLLIVTSGRTTRAQAKRAQEQLERAHAKLAGVIMLDG